MNQQQMNVKELGLVQALIIGLQGINTTDLDFEVRIGDSNGERVGTVKRDGDEYQFFYWVHE